MKISIIIPVYNGAMTIPLLVDDLMQVLRNYALEIVLVNDGSTDNSHEACASVFARHKGIVKYLCLAKNFGEHNAAMAGLNHATGDYAVFIDDDFQNPPEEILKLVNKAISERLDVVYAYYEKKHHSFYRNMGSRFNDCVASILLDKPRDLYLCSFKCISRFIINEIIKYKGPFPYIDGLILRNTRNIGKVLVEHRERQKGKSGYTLGKLIRLWMNMFTNFSLVPLRISMVLGLAFSAFGGVLSIDMIIEKLIHPEIPVGIASILVSVLTFSGIQLLLLGVLGEYLGILFLSENKMPQYVVRHLFAQGKEDDSCGQRTGDASDPSKLPPAERVALGSPPEGGIWLRKAPVGPTVIHYLNSKRP